VSTWLGSWILDAKQALRTLRAQPGFSLAVALTLALGLGLNATVLGMMDAMLLRPFQFPDHERLVIIWDSPTATAERQSVAPANYLDWRRQATTVQQLTAWEGWSAVLTGHDEAAERLQAFRVTPGFFELLHAPALGRPFEPNEAEPGQDKVVVIGDGLWKRRFGADPRIIGTQIRVNDEPYTVVGVAAAGFDFPVGAQVWAPLALTPTRAADREHRGLTVLGRLAPNASIADARAEFSVIGRRLAQSYPDTNRDRAAAPHTLSAAFREDSSGSFIAILQVGAGLVLLIACANLAGLLLARANDRQREVAVRTALGAARGRIIRQLITEIVVLGLVASAFALVFARIALDVVRSSIPADIAQHVEGWNNLRLDSRLMLATPALAIGLGLLLGLIPAIAAVRTELAGVLKAGARGATGSGGRQRVRQGLVIAEIACALALLVGAGLTLGAGLRVAHQPGGFDARQLLRFDLALSETKYASDASRRTLADTLAERIAALPTVEGVALANVLPASGWSPSVTFRTEADRTPDAARLPRAGFRTVSPGYFETMRIPIVKGRTFTGVDREGSQEVAIVSASLAARLWPGQNPVGQRLRLDERAQGEGAQGDGAEGEAPQGQATQGWTTVVGVARDVTMYNWWDGIDVTAIYRPLRQAPPAGEVKVVVRTRGEAADAGSALRTAVSSVDPLLAIHELRTMQQAIDGSTFGLKFLATLIGVSGAIALALSFIGIYSLMAYAISQRTREFGVRMALGATSADVLRLTVKQAGVLTGIGITLGLMLSVTLASLMSSAMFGLIALDPLVFGGVSLVVAAAALIAAYIPARKSLALDPATILRAQ
jgi:putative ABC transport system permease protein